jgi:hypothetical protein
MAQQSEALLNVATGDLLQGGRPFYEHSDTSLRPMR